MNEVVLSGLAESDLADIWAFIARDDHVSLAVGSYVIFYREGKRAIEVARVLHGRRDITAIFRS